VRIANIEASWVHVPIADADSHKSDYGKIKSFDAAIVRVETACGLIGWGEGKNAAGSQGRYASLVHLINEELAPRLIGRDPRDIIAIWEDSYNGVRAAQAAARGYPLPDLARSGLSIAGLSAIDIALWDILGKSLGEPVWRLLGGRRVASLPTYASGGWADAAGIGEQLAGYVKRGGFGAVKMRVGSMDRSVHASAERVIAARAHLGPDIELMCDAHGTYSVAEAKRFAYLVRDCDLAWFEEPVNIDDKAGMAELRAATAIPIAAGESEYTRFPFRDLIAARAADILQPDLAVCGGLTEGLRIAALAAGHNLRLAPHMWLGAPGFAAGLHLCAVSPAAFIVEYSLGANPMIHDLVEERFEVSDGRIALPDGPGLGITVKEDFVKNHAKKRT